MKNGNSKLTKRKLARQFFLTSNFVQIIERYLIIDFLQFLQSITESRMDKRFDIFSLVKIQGKTQIKSTIVKIP